MASAKNLSLAASGDCQGFLFKLKQNNKEWKKLYVVLKGGEIITGFGIQQDPTLRTRSESRGWLIKSSLRTPVRAIHSGRVAFSGWYRGFGNLVILDHGGDHYSLYAHLNSVARRQDDQIQQGSVVGDVGETGSLNGPQLYFELRVGRKPVDPAEWLLGGGL